MSRLRAAAALAALLTALLLQGSVIGPVTVPLPVSLPAVLVAAVALVDGPGVGLAFGFAAGLIADLGSEHPAGVLALCWLALGLACGLCAPGTAAVRPTVRRDVALTAVGCGLACVAATLLLAVLGADGATAGTAMADAVPAALIDAVLAVAVVPLVRVFLRNDSLRAPRPVLVLGADA